LQRKNKTSLFKNKPLLAQCIQHRHNKSALQNIALEAEHVLDAAAILSTQADDYFNIANYLHLMPLQEVKEVSLLLEQEGYEPALIIVNYIFRHFQNGRLNENLIKGLDDYKVLLSEQHRASMGSFGLFSLFIADEEEHHVALLKTLNTTTLKACFSYLLNTQEFDHRDVTFNDVLKYDYATNLLYHPSGDLSPSSFVAAKLRAEQPKTFKDAREKATLYMRYGAEFQTPLNAFPHESTEENHIYTLIKSGEFGTLAEIFALLDLSEGFKSHFPTEEEFWASSRSFQEIIWSLKNNASYLTKYTAC
jgi:hypothetical protein